MMKAAKLVCRLLLSVGLGGFFLTTAGGTTVLPPTFEEMTDRAEMIFVGTVVSSRAEWRFVGSSTNRVIFTLVEFDTQEVLKGSTNKTVTLQFLGGTVGDATMEVAGVPQFKPGDRVILFVERNGVQFCPLVGVFHGKFGIRKSDRHGRDIVVMHDGKPLQDVAQIAVGDGVEFGPQRAGASIPADREPMSPDDFKVKILARIESSRMSK